MKQLGGFYNAKKGCTRSHKFGSVLNVLRFDGFCINLGKSLRRALGVRRRITKMIDGQTAKFSPPLGGSTNGPPKKTHKPRKICGRRTYDLEVVAFSL